MVTPVAEVKKPNEKSSVGGRRFLISGSAARWRVPLLVALIAIAVLAAIGGLRPSLPPTSAIVGSDDPGGPDGRWAVVALLLVTALILAVRPSRRRRRG